MCTNRNKKYIDDHDIVIDLVTNDKVYRIVVKY